MKHQGPLAKDPEAAQFNHQFPDNGQWHFVNLPLGSAEYTDNGRFSADNDVVQIINQCVKILETPEGQKTRFTKKQALKFLVHLVGDIHQPLHVGTGYYDLSGPTPVLIEDPAKAYRKQNDALWSHPL